ncbi:MAG: hypothetical protein ACI8QZ_004126 [Chlamydiales bacterium]|jgi:hypothetical protein
MVDEGTGPQQVVTGATKRGGRIIILGLQDLVWANPGSAPPQGSDDRGHERHDPVLCTNPAGAQLTPKQRLAAEHRPTSRPISGPTHSMGTHPLPTSDIRGAIFRQAARW